MIPYLILTRLAWALTLIACTAISDEPNKSFKTYVFIFFASPAAALILLYILLTRDMELVHRNFNFNVNNAMLGTSIAIDASVIAAMLLQ